MENIVQKVKPFIKKDLIIAILIAGFLILTGSPSINSRGINTILFLIIVLTLWKFKKTNQFLLSTNRVLQMTNLIGIVFSLAVYVINVFMAQIPVNLASPLILVFGFLLQGAIYYYLSIWSKLLKEGKEVNLSEYRDPLIIIFVIIGIFSFFGGEIMKFLS